MNILVVGSGGREHAICEAFSRSSRVAKIYCANGNAGIAQIAECVPVKPEEIERLAEFAVSNDIGLTFVGGETALALGIVDQFESRGLKIIGPTKAAAELEASKAFSKDFMSRHGVPTAKYFVADSLGAAQFVLVDEYQTGPVVVKADGLAAGKGVAVCKNLGEALSALEQLESIAGKSATQRIVIEEFLRGREVSLIMFADGEDFALMPPTRDHKRIGEGDTGPNTGGMGTITDASLLTDAKTQDIIETIIKPTLKGCKKEGFPFRGILFLGLMMTAEGPKLLEYNVRFGDPETQSILVRLETDLVDICEAMLEGRLADIDIRWKPGSSATVVLAAESYPHNPRKGDVISGLDDVRDVTIFHAGTALSEPGALATGQHAKVSEPGAIATGQQTMYQTAGGRVLGITATGENLDEALSTCYRELSKISFEGMQYRRDIGR